MQHDRPTVWRARLRAQGPARFTLLIYSILAHSENWRQQCGVEVGSVSRCLHKLLISCSRGSSGRLNNSHNRLLFKPGLHLSLQQAIQCSMTSGPRHALLEALCLWAPGRRPAKLDAPREGLGDRLWEPGERTEAELHPEWASRGPSRQKGEQEDGVTVQEAQIWPPPSSPSSAPAKKAME